MQDAKTQTKSCGDEEIDDKKVKKADTLYLDILIKEYEMELNKKQSLETRAGFVITILCALSIFLFEKVPLSALLQDMKTTPLTFILLIKKVIGLLVYIMYGLALGFSMKVIGINTLLDIKLDWKPEHLYQNSNQTIETFVHQYLMVVQKRREIDNKKAKRLRIAYLSSIIVIALMVLFDIF